MSAARCLQIQQQRVKHLQYEQQAAVAGLKAEALKASHLEQAAAAAQVASEMALQAELQQKNIAQVGLSIPRGPKVKNVRLKANHGCEIFCFRQQCGAYCV